MTPMSDVALQLDTFTRYERLIRPTLVGATATPLDMESDLAIQVERGEIFARAMTGGYTPELSRSIARLIDETLIDATTLPRLAVIDRAGHRRPVYPGLLIYAWLQTYRLLYEKLPPGEFARWEEPLRAWCDLLEADVAGLTIADTGIKAAAGSDAVRAVWDALALSVAGGLFHRDAWTDLAADTFGRVTRSQQPNGQFLMVGPSDNPETHWYDELVLLHALSSFAVQTEDRTVAAAVHRATELHLRETQPDHATHEPWALFALIWNPQTHPLADQMLHGTTVQRAQSNAGVSLMLLADALYCLELFR